MRTKASGRQRRGRGEGGKGRQGGRGAGRGRYRRLTLLFVDGIIPSRWLPPLYPLHLSLKSHLEALMLPLAAGVCVSASVRKRRRERGGEVRKR